MRKLADGEHAVVVYPDEHWPRLPGQSRQMAGEVCGSGDLLPLEQVVAVRAVLHAVAPKVPVRGCLCFLTPAGFMADNAFRPERHRRVRFSVDSLGCTAVV